MTLDIKATNAMEPMTPAKTTEPTQMESTSSYSGSVTQKLENTYPLSICT